MGEVKPLPLSIRDLSFQYNSRATPAIKNISFDVYPGEVLLIAGSSGCGKTTLTNLEGGASARKTLSDGDNLYSIKYKNQLSIHELDQ